MNLLADPGFKSVDLTWTEPGDSGFAGVEITWTPADGTPVGLVPKGTEQLTISHLTNGTPYTFTVKAVDTTGNTSAGTSETATPIVIQDLTIKFGKRASASVALTQAMVSETFTDLHNLISNPQPGEDFTYTVELGDYIDLVSLTIAGSPTIYDVPININPRPYDPGRLLRLMVVGINSFQRDGAAANNPLAPDHVVFQFDNVPVKHIMKPGPTNVGGYPASEMRTYINGPFLTGLKTATGLDDTMLWAPKRMMSLGGNPEIGIGSVEDMLWLPTDFEMTGDHTDWMYYGGVASLHPYTSENEVNAGQARLEYYPVGWNSPLYYRRVVYGADMILGGYFLASPQVGDARCYIALGGGGGDSSYSYYSSYTVGVVPAFCVR
ncbi:hypothetical protein AGMMS50268_40650 [Spirochaetia bacterium]|nr:hypothetical protein AGMMS50268_40650 [Spirochaetia bacterium]